MTRFLIVFFSFSLQRVLTLRMYSKKNQQEKIQHKNVFDVKVHSYAEFAEIVRQTYGSLASDHQVKHQTNETKSNLTRPVGAPQLPGWVFINHHWGVCYEAALANLRDIGWCAAKCSPVHNLVNVEQLELYPSPPGFDCLTRGYTNFAQQDEFYPGNTWSYFGWKMVPEAKALLKDSPSLNKIQESTHKQPSDKETAQHVEYLVKSLGILSSDEYSYLHPECLSPNAKPSQIEAAAKGRAAQSMLYPTMDLGYKGNRFNGTRDDE